MQALAMQRERTGKNVHSTFRVAISDACSRLDKDVGRPDRATRLRRFVQRLMTKRTIRTTTTTTTTTGRVVGGATTVLLPHDNLSSLKIG